MKRKDLEHWGTCQKCHTPRVFLYRVRRSLFCEACANGYRPYQHRKPQTEYEKYLQTPHWRIFRAQTLARAGFRCGRCHSKVLLQVHHLTYARLGNELFEDVCVRCERCHKREHHLQ
jgi:5-methylcytosine-specific restriction endonuclease McrA